MRGRRVLYDRREIALFGDHRRGGQTGDSGFLERQREVARDGDVRRGVSRLDRCQSVDSDRVYHICYRLRGRVDSRLHRF